MAEAKGKRGNKGGKQGGGDAKGVKVNDDRQHQIRIQIEFYLSRENLQSDAFLLSRLSPDLWVDMEVLCGFNALRALHTTAQDLPTALEGSEVVEVDPVGHRLRPKWRLERRTLILRDIPTNLDKAEVATIFEHLDSSERPVELKGELGDNWFVTFPSEALCTKAHLSLMGRTFKDKPIHARVKSETLLRSVYQTPPRSAVLPTPVYPMGTGVMYDSMAVYNGYSQPQARSSAPSHPKQRSGGGSAGAGAAGTRPPREQPPSKGRGKPKRGPRRSPEKGDDHESPKPAPKVEPPKMEGTHFPPLPGNMGKGRAQGNGEWAGDSGSSQHHRHHPSRPHSHSKHPPHQQAHAQHPTPNNAAASKSSPGDAKAASSGTEGAQAQAPKGPAASGPSPFLAALMSPKPKEEKEKESAQAEPKGSKEGEEARAAERAEEKDGKGPHKSGENKESPKGAANSARGDDEGWEQVRRGKGEGRRWRDEGRRGKHKSEKGHARENKEAKEAGGEAKAGGAEGAKE